tara:strand:- start:749 stop:1123 length:375 start_codon:yes stop_codon:yes gene_type:complete
MDLIDKQILDRTIRAIRCLSFNYQFYEDVKCSGLSASEVFKMKVHYFSRNSFTCKNSENIESAFRWLITLGVLRREVDGQGLTSKVRLTPLGHQIFKDHSNLLNNKITFVEKTKNCLYRKIKFQ